VKTGQTIEPVGFALGEATQSAHGGCPPRVVRAGYFYRPTHRTHFIKLLCDQQLFSASSNPASSAVGAARGAAKLGPRQPGEPLLWICRTCIDNRTGLTGGGIRGNGRVNPENESPENDNTKDAIGQCYSHRLRGSVAVSSLGFFV